MILVTSVLSVISALLVQRVFNSALFVRGGPDLGALYPLVAALIAIPIANGVLNVAQTYLTEVVGNRVLQNLRDQLFAHLERLSPAFYTATRGGEVQSRLANDVGGVQTTITSTASSVVSNVVTLVSSVVAMLILSPLLTVISLAVTPVFVFFSRRVGSSRREARRQAQASLAAMGSITQETLSVSGILLAKVFGRQQREVQRYREENGNQADQPAPAGLGGRAVLAGAVCPDLRADRSAADDRRSSRRADAIFAIQGGQVVEHGTHEELLEAGGLYRRLYDEQFGDGAIEAHRSDGVILANGRPCCPSARADHDGDQLPEPATTADPLEDLPAELRTSLRA